MLCSKGYYSIYIVHYVVKGTIVYIGYSKGYCSPSLILLYYDNPLSFSLSLSLLIQFDDGKSVFPAANSNWTAESIIRFINDERLPYVTLFSDEVIDH